MNRILQTRSLFFLIVLFGIFVMAARPVTDPDLWWHLRTGQLIVQNHQLFHADPYSFTKAGQPWLDHEWLSQIVIFLIYRSAGYGGLMVVFAAIIAAAFLVVYWRSPGRPYVAGVVTVWGALASVPCWGVRPQMLTLLLASILLLVLERSYARPGLLWAIPALLLLWVNLHAGYALGIGFIGLFLVGDALDLMLGWPTAGLSIARLRRLGLVLAISLLMVPVNPYGAELYLYPFQTLHSRAMQFYIGEWFSPNFHDAHYLATLVMVLATLAVPMLSPRRLRPREILLLIVTMWAALRSVRHIPIYMLVAVPLLSAMITAWLEQRKASSLLTGSGRPLTSAKLGFNAIMLAAVVLAGVLRVRYVLQGQSTAEGREFPSAAVAFLADGHIPGHIMNHYNWGGYFIWKLYPEVPVYIDGRADLYGDTFMDQFAATYYLKGKAWADPLTQWNIRTVVLPPDAPLITALRSSPAWKTVFADKQTVVVTKVIDPQRSTP